MRNLILSAAIVLSTFTANASFLLVETGNEDAKYRAAIRTINESPFISQGDLTESLAGKGLQPYWVPPTLWDLNAIVSRISDKDNARELLPTVKNSLSISYTADVNKHPLVFLNRHFLQMLELNDIKPDELPNKFDEVFDILVQQLHSQQEKYSDRRSDTGLKLITHLEHPVLKAAMHFEIQCRKENKFALFRTTPISEGSKVVIGDGEYALPVVKANRYALYGSEGNSNIAPRVLDFVGVRPLSFGYSPLSGFLFDGTIGTVGASYNPTPSACCYSYFLEHRRDLMFVEETTPETLTLNNLLNCSPEDMKKGWKKQGNGNVMMIAFALPISKIETLYKKLIFLPSVPAYAQVLGKGEVFHPRSKGTFFDKDENLKDFTCTSPANAARKPVYAYRILLNLCNWLKGATVIGFNGETYEPVQEGTLAPETHLKSLESLAIKLKEMPAEEAMEALIKFLNKKHISRLLNY